MGTIEKVADPTIDIDALVSASGAISMAIELMEKNLGSDKFLLVPEEIREELQEQHAGVVAVRDLLLEIAAAMKFAIRSGETGVKVTFTVDRKNVVPSPAKTPQEPRGIKQPTDDEIARLAERLAKALDKLSR